MQLVPITFVDLETTGTDTSHFDWSVTALRCSGFDPSEGKFAKEEWYDEQIKMPDIAVSLADPTALRMNHFYQLYDAEKAKDPKEVAEAVARFTAETVIAGITVGPFDMPRLDRLMRANGFAPAWHYHPIDVKDFAVGVLLGKRRKPTLDYMPPWSTAAIASEFGIDVENYDLHTSADDVRLARDLWVACHA